MRRHVRRRRHVDDGRCRGGWRRRRARPPPRRSSGSAKATPDRPCKRCSRSWSASATTSPTAPTATSGPARPPRSACSSSRTVSTRPGSSPRTRRAISGLPAGVPAATAPAAASSAAGAAAPTAAAAPGSFVGLRQGATGRTVRQLQLAILATGLYLSGGADGTFGSSTHRGVTLVQRVNGLPETGVVDARHGARPRSDGERLLPVGSRSGRHRCPGRRDRRRGAARPATAHQVRGHRRRRRRRRVRPTDPPIRRRLPEAARALRDRHRRRGDRRRARQGRRRTAAAPPQHRRRTSVCASGSTGPAVTKLQQAIMATGLVVRGGADGIFGQQTRTAVLVYQRVNGLSQTGIVDEATARMLGLLDRRPGSRWWLDIGRLVGVRGFASVRRARRPCRGTAEGVDQGRDQLHRRRRRRVRVGDGRGGDEVPAGPRSARSPASSTRPRRQRSACRDCRPRRPPQPST